MSLSLKPVKGHFMINASFFSVSLDNKFGFISFNITILIGFCLEDPSPLDYFRAFCNWMRSQTLLYSMDFISSWYQSIYHTHCFLCHVKMKSNPYLFHCQNLTLTNKSHYDLKWMIFFITLFVVHMHQILVSYFISEVFTQMPLNIVKVFSNKRNNICDWWGSRYI